ncbi:type 2 isopentenyl-diphosphate Delta-isomerase [Dactylosporangium sp. CA-092794]|uniref:type 2 isopentenyl-diphosphate Delta-isomerase n=1 Tax=Dactylosporangium sp. CA-092794 TaxID=3239929 RepID=UPI003D8B0609
MSDASSAELARRKAEHVALGLAEASQDRAPAAWREVHLVPSCLPAGPPDQIAIHTTLLGRSLAAPLCVAGMTGGHPDGHLINARLARAAERYGLALGVGSQRVALRDASLAPTFAVVRQVADPPLVLANLGVSQLLGGDRGRAAGDVARAVEMVRADALAVHLNALEELVQPEGDALSGRWLEALAAAVADSPVPIVAKETGAGMDRCSVRRMIEVGVAAVDVGGRGGTSFARIEAERAQRAGDVRRHRLGLAFADWGLPTPISVLEARGQGVPVIASGGVRTGIDAAKALALGADLVAIGRPLLAAAVGGEAALADAVEQFLDELRCAMTLSGAASIADLRAQPVVLDGLSARWSRQRS